MHLSVALVVVIVFGGFSAVDSLSASASSYHKKLIPSLAIDGNTDGMWKSGSCYMSSNLEADPWWMMDLGSVQAVSSVTIYNRADCCGWRLRRITVKVFEDDPQKTNSKGVLCATFPGMAENGQALKLQCASPINGRYIQIFKTKKANTWDVLAFCEVKADVAEPAPECSPDFSAVGSECLAFSQVKASYAEALVYCEISGSDLLMLTSKAQDDAVRQHIADKRLTGNYYIGANDMQEPDVYRWVNGELVEASWKPKVEVTNIAEHHKNAESGCGYLNADSNAAWESMPCNIPNFFVCQAQKA